MVKCSVAQWDTDSLDQADRKAVREWIAAGQSMASVFAVIATVNDNRFKLTAFKDHMRQRCCCAEG